MVSVLDSIIEGVREDLNIRRRNTPQTVVEELIQGADPVRDAEAALRGGRDDDEGVRIIAEVKRSSPSKGALADIPQPGSLAQRYEEGTASVISVLTEQRRFGGTLADLDAVRAAVDIPVLRKDFTVDPYQIYEARAHGADMVLLIVAALDDHQLKDFYDLTTELSMTALVEAHTESEISRAADLGASVVGINVRNLKTLEIHRDHYTDLAAHLPERAIRIAESGVVGAAEVRSYANQGADAVLVGEALVRHGDPRASLEHFRQASLRRDES